VATLAGWTEAMGLPWIQMSFAHIPAEAVVAWIAAAVVPQVLAALGKLASSMVVLWQNGEAATLAMVAWMMAG